jgi:hypothetical protein
MRTFSAVFLALALLAPGTQAQEYHSPFTGYSDELPNVSLNSRAVALQKSLYPEYYNNHSALRDMRWVARHDSAAAEFFEVKKSLILKTLSELSGLSWQEREFDVYLLRYYTTAGNGDPLIIPVGGIRRGHLTESTPDGSRMQLNLIYQLARRMLAQCVNPERDYYHPIADHPLMQPGAYRRDNLAMLLALVTAERVIGLDSTYTAYQSAFWKQRHPGREVFEQYLLNEWILSPERPLAQWVVEEPYGSRLVTITRPPRRSRTSSTGQALEYIEGLPLKGQLGFSVTVNPSNKLVVDKIDLERVAFACGLRESDIVRQVNGERVRSHKDMIEKILATFDAGGATLQVVREEENMTILLQPVDLGYDDEHYFWPEEDSLLFDSVETISPSPDY